MQLTKTEEQLMQRLWELERSFMKDLIDSYPDPKPAPTTIATLLKRMSDKG
ncbi:MAG TPA: BlaI/MecI/CopY family transcriptional regulator, partial [Hanamia sp.]